MRLPSMVAPPEGVLGLLNNDGTIESNVGNRLPSSSNALLMFFRCIFCEFVMHFASPAAV
jgi:hypothetical protein